eukprot:scaffold2933_cov245-Pinguiococcus_pyrenoidosus.AAC.3
MKVRWVLLAICTLARAFPLAAQKCPTANCADCVRSALRMAAVDSDTAADVLRHMGLAQEPRRLAEEGVFSGMTVGVSIVMAVICVVSAALAAGLTMGLVSLDPLDLKVRTLAPSRVVSEAPEVETQI